VVRPAEVSKGKYPPAEPGALGIGPLEAAVGVADAAPVLMGGLKMAGQSPRIQLIEAAVFLLPPPQLGSMARRGSSTPVSSGRKPKHFTLDKRCDESDLLFVIEVSR
jgi:hypothetical protein